MEVLPLIQFLLFIGLVNSLPRPKYMNFCPKTDSNYKECVIKAAQEVLNSIGNGDKKYGIPSLSPLTLSLFEVDDGNNFKLKFQNIDSLGLADSEVKDVEIKDKEMKITLFMKKLQFTGPYEASGKILVLPIEGKGLCNITAVDADVTYVCNLEPYEGKNKVTFAKVTSKSLDFEVKRTYFQFGNLFNGDQKLGDHVNNFMNENWEEVVKDLKPSVSQVISEIVTSIIGSFFKKIPFNELFAN